MKLQSKKIIKIGFYAIFISIAFPSIAYAYLDPGTGSYIIQIIIGAIVGILFTVKIYWKKISLSLSNLFSKKQKTEKDDI